MKNKKIAVFLDRDGTLIEEVGYLKKVEDIKFIDNSPAAIKKLNDNGILVILITNQSGVARGFFTENDVKKVNDELNRLLKEKNACLDGIYYCPHHKKGSVKEYSIECNCRKPNIGLIQQALKDFETIEIPKSYVIGDKAIDIELAKKAGCKGILVKTGYGSEAVNDLNESSIKPEFISKDINSAVDWILQQDSRLY